MSLIRKYALRIILSQLVLLLLLGYFLYGSRASTEEEVVVKRDTITQVKRDTVWIDTTNFFNFPNPEPDTQITEATKDTVVKRDTVFITEGPGVRLYKERFSSNQVSGLVTSRVRGNLLSQRVRITSSIPRVRIVRDRTITKETTRTIIGKWRPVASVDVFFKDGIEIIAPGVGLQRPTKFSVFYKYDVKNGYHGGSANVPLSLIF